MTQIIKSADRHYSDMGWLQTYWHFSFSDYNDPENMHFGPLRVFNDDVIQGGGGFGMHPHRDMEIVTYVTEGELEHKDHLGNRGVIRPGEVQMMRAGKGILHSEYNASKEKPARLMQLWIMPRTKGLAPGWEQKRFSPEERAGKLMPVISSGDVPGTLVIDQDATVFVSALRPGETVRHETKPGRLLYLFVISGAVKANDWSLAKGDQARMDDQARLAITASENAELILLDLPAV